MELTEHEIIQKYAKNCGHCNEIHYISSNSYYINDGN